MSVLDKVLAAVHPPESEEARREARLHANNAASAGDWLSLVLYHHRQIEAAFAAVEVSNTLEARSAAHTHLALILTGHSIAEESVLYPALALADEKSHATTAYTEQSAAKVELAALARLPPLSQDYVDKLRHLKGAVIHHMYEEEGTWFLDLRRKVSSADQSKITARYVAEFNRYVHED